MSEPPPSTPAPSAPSNLSENRNVEAEETGVPKGAAKPPGTAAGAAAGVISLFAMLAMR